MIGAVLAQAPAAPPPPPVWQVDHGETFCSVIHRPRADPGLIVMLRMVPRSGAVDLLFSRADDDQEPEAPRKIVVQIDDVIPPGTTEVDAFSHPRPDGAPLTGVQIPRSVVDQFLSGRRLSLVSDGATILRVTPPVSARPQQAVGTCEQALITSWGFDPEQPPGVIRRPELIYDPMDYPLRAWSEGKGGGAYLLAAVQPNGRVSECRILLSSGRTDLDEASCREMQRHGRFETFEGPPRMHIAAIVWRVQ